MSRTFSTNERVGRELEGVDQVRFEPEGPPDARDRRLAHPGRLGHRARRPVGGVGRGLFEGLDDHRFDVVVADGAWRTRVVARRGARRGAGSRTDCATCRPCADRPRGARPPRCCVRPRHRPARCDSAGPTPARSSGAAPSARASSRSSSLSTTGSRTDRRIAPPIVVDDEENARGDERNSPEWTHF